MIASLGAWVWWLLVNGYVAAYFLGVITVFQIGIVKNSKQIRKNSEQVRKNSETIRQGMEAKLRADGVWNGRP